ncbi:divalent metal cation transporter [Bacteroidia bacterium]|nr:divalent metal cation transporter [Bacteroidia bacterium]MDC1394931.1 divalent metal cation transporter [Bacteroidia bacterium]
MLNQIKSLGPGLLYAGAAIGVSHLVQSTKAGAQYGYVLIIAILLAHIFKYPFFALGPRYANLTGESLVKGYAKMGKWAVFLLLILTVCTMFTVQAAVTIVTAGLVQKMTGTTLSAPVISLFLLSLCFLILQVGKFSILDNLMKVIMIILSISTVAAFVFSFGVDREVIPSAKAIFNITTNKDLSFLIAFVGWMPAPLDIAIWHSIWTLAKGKTTDSEFDFRIGFYGTAILGICFLVLGANTMYGSGISIESSAGGFASQLIDAFTSSLGQWSYWFILIAAFTTMFSTTLTCYDAIPRVMTHIGLELSFPIKSNTNSLWRIILGLGSLVILFFFVKNMRQMVTFATSISFLTAPALAFLSYRLVYKHHNKSNLWSKAEKWIALVGIVILLTLGLLHLMSLAK